MPSNWIRRIFNRPSLKNSSPKDRSPKDSTSVAMLEAEQESVNAQLPAQDPAVAQDKRAVVDDVSINHHALYGEQLDNAFFCWLLDCQALPSLHEAELDKASEPHKNQISCKHQEQKLIKLLDHDLSESILIPRRPASLPMLIKLLNDEDSSHEQISDILLSDPALTAEILKTANTPFFRSTADDVTSIKQAVLVLGRQGVRNIISATILIPMLKGEGSKEGPFSKKAWQWALLSATASDLYAQIKEYDPGPLYLMALLPSLAYLVIFRSLLRYEKSHPELGEIEASVIRSVIKQRSWPICHKISAQWGLPDSCEHYLLEAEKNVQDTVFSPLRDGLVFGRHTILQGENRSPLNDKQLVHLTCASATTNAKISEALNKSLKEED